MTHGPRTAPPPRPQRDTAADKDSVGLKQRQSNGADISRPKNDIHLHNKYSILAPEEPEDPEEPEGGPANTGPQLRGDGHGATRGTTNQEQTETETGDGTGQRVLLARGMQENDDEEQRTATRCGALPNGRSRLTGAATKGGGGGIPEAWAYGAQFGASGGPPDTAVRTPSARPQDGGGGGTPHPSLRANRARAGEQWGHPNQAAQPQRAVRGKRRRGTPQTAACAPRARAGERLVHPK